MSDLEIIGTGYGKEVEIGESYLQFSVVSMWDFTSLGQFYCFSSGGFKEVIYKKTYKGDGLYSVHVLTNDEITPEMTELILSKGYTCLSNLKK